MTTIALLARLRALDVTLALEGDRVKVSAPEGALTRDLRAELTARKTELVSFLRQGCAPDRTAICRVAGRDNLPLSFAQQRFWFLEQLVPGTAAYHVCFGIRFAGRLDSGVLGRCLNEIVRRHEILRTVFETVDGQTRQTVVPSVAVPLPIVDLNGAAASERADRFSEAAHAMVRKPFDLAADTPMRTRLFALAPDDHALVVAVHHIAVDAWSVGVFVKELGALYDAFSSGKASPLSELAIQYADFASWQREQLERRALDAQREYWITQLADLPTLQLPTDRPRPPFQTFRGGRQRVALSRSLTDALEALSRRERATLFMTLLAAFNALLHRYTGQNDLVVGTAIAGRQCPELEPLIGPFINSLVMRTDASGDPTFRALLNRVREVALHGYANQDLPFEKVVDELRPERSVNRNPLFQVMLALQNVPMPALELRDLRLSSIDLDRGTAVSDLELMFSHTPAGLDGYARYSADLFNATTVERMLDQFRVLLEGVVADPDRRLSELPLLTEVERQQLAALNSTAADYPRDGLVHEAFDRQVDRAPDAIAIVWRDEHLTYRELNARANALAHQLIARSVAPDDRVAICLERSPNFIIAALAALKAGGAYVPLDPAYPPQRLAFMLADARARLVLTERSLYERVRDCGVPAACIDDEPVAFERFSESPAVALDAQNLAYVIYTSGSTGQPKGVALAHRGLMNLVTWHQRAYGVSERDAAALIAGLGFDASVWELWPYLTAGACIHIPDDETRGSASLLLEWLADSRVSICFVPTPLAEAMVDSALPAHLALRALLTGGDKLHRVPPRLPFTVYNNYGPTESTVVATWTGVHADGSETPPPIGKPIDNTRTHVLDRSLNPVPLGVPGELYVAGEGLARGYLNRPELTGEHFRPDPFGPERGSRMYRTGDLVKRLPDGNLEFIGRIDDQVKIRGFRIELGEIEALLRQQPGVRDAVVITREDVPGTKRLVAYLVSIEGDHPATVDIKTHLAARLPEYMVPGAIVWLSALPITANGKIDRRALPEPSLSSLDPDSDAGLPRSEAERALADIWARVLRLARVGVHDNFFEMGGDSILALQVIAAARQQGLRLTPRQIFEYPTVAGLALVAGSTGAVSTPQDRPVGEVPLTPIQRWFLEQNVPEPAHFNQALMLLASERLDAGRLQQAFEHLLDHHDALRLRFVRDNQSWKQFYTPHGGRVEIDRINLSKVADSQRPLAMRSEADRIQAGLDLANGPLVRAALFELGATEPQRLLIAVHHLVVDAVSWRILLADLQQIYTQLARGEAPRLPEKTSSFKAWASRLHEYDTSKISASEVQYWLDAASVRASIPVDISNGGNTVASARTAAFTASLSDTEALLREVPKVYGMQIHEVVLTALARSLVAWSGTPRVRLHQEGHGRDGPFDDLDLSRTVGWFTTLYPVVLDLDGARDPGEALKRVKEQVRGVPNRGSGYGLLRYSRSDSQAALLRAAPNPPISFNYLGQFDVEAERALLTPALESAGALESPRMLRAHAIAVSAHIAGGQLRLTFTYSESLHRRSTIEALGRATLVGLSELIDHCRAPEAGGFTASDFPEANVSQDELDRLLARIGPGTYE